METNITNSLDSSCRIGFIGAGNLAQILIKGFLKADLTKPSNIFASDIDTNTLASVHKLGISTTTSNAEIVEKCTIIIIAVEPQVVPVVLTEVKSALTPQHLIVSVAAGVKLDTIAKHVPEGSRIIRVMANTPTCVECGATVFSAGTHATKKDADIVKDLFASVGLCEMLPETYLDAVTGVSGSGPAYVYVAIEALSDGGVKMGLPRNMATKLAAQTFMGAAKMVLETGQHPGQLKDNVTSPGGTTIAALHALEKEGFRAALIGAVEAATNKSKELGAE